MTPKLSFSSSSAQSLLSPFHSVCFKECDHRTQFIKFHPLATVTTEVSLLTSPNQAICVGCQPGRLRRREGVPTSSGPVPWSRRALLVTSLVCLWRQSVWGVDREPPSVWWFSMNKIWKVKAYMMQPAPHMLHDIGGVGRMWPEWLSPKQTLLWLRLAASPTEWEGKNQIVQLEPWRKWTCSLFNRHVTNRPRLSGRLQSTASLAFCVCVRSMTLLLDVFEHMSIAEGSTWSVINEPILAGVGALRFEV